MTISTSRRAVLAGAAALPALSLPAIAATEPDPIFAAIANWERAYAYLGECLTKKAAFDDTYFALRSEAEAMLEANRPEVIDEVSKAFGGKYTDEEAFGIAWCAMDDKAKRESDYHKGDELEQHGHDVIDKAEAALFETRPTTRAGWIALISFVLDSPDPDWFEDRAMVKVLETTKEAIRAKII